MCDHGGDKSPSKAPPVTLPGVACVDSAFLPLVSSPQFFAASVPYHGGGVPENELSGKVSGEVLHPQGSNSPALDIVEEEDVRLLEEVLLDQPEPAGSGAAQQVRNEDVANKADADLPAQTDADFAGSGSSNGGLGADAGGSLESAEPGASNPRRSQRNIGFPQVDYRTVSRARMQPRVQPAATTTCDKYSPPGDDFGRQKRGRKRSASMAAALDPNPDFASMTQEQKRQRRLIRNRMSAHAHRERRKKAFASLQHNLEESMKKNEELGARVTRLELLNKHLNRTVNLLQALVCQAEQNGFLGSSRSVQDTSLANSLASLPLQRLASFADLTGVTGATTGLDTYSALHGLALPHGTSPAVNSTSNSCLNHGL